MAPRERRPEGILAVTEIREIESEGPFIRRERGTEFIEIDREKGERAKEEERKREGKRERDATNTAPDREEGGDLNTRYEIEPMGRARRMQISPITHAGYFAIIIAVHARGRVSYDGEFRGYPSPGKICPLSVPRRSSHPGSVKYCPLNPEPSLVFF